MNQVRYGVYSQVLSAAGCTIDHVRSVLLTTWGIPTDYIAYVDRHPVPGHYTLKPGEPVEFHRNFSTKSVVPNIRWLRLNLRSLVVVKAG